MTHAEILARVNRLTKLSAGLGKEASAIVRRSAEASVREIQEYLAALRDCRTLSIGLGLHCQSCLIDPNLCDPHAAVRPPSHRGR